MIIRWKAEVDEERDVNLDMQVSISNNLIRDANLDLTVFISNELIKCDETIITRGITVEMKAVTLDVIPLVVKAVKNYAADPDSSGDS